MLQRVVFRVASNKNTRADIATGPFAAREPRAVANQRLAGVFMAAALLGGALGCDTQAGVVAGQGGGNVASGGGGAAVAVASSSSGGSQLPNGWTEPLGVDLDGWTPTETDWCREGWIGLDESTCFYLPESNARPTRLLVFLHGMMPPDASSHSQQAIVEQAAESQGFAALFPRGRKGMCSWAESVSDWYCWPTNRDNVDAHAQLFAAEWSAAVELLEEVAELSFTQRYLLGFSNGGYFDSYVGLENWWPLDGVGLVAAGRSYIDVQLLAAAKPPMYIASGALDIQSVQNSAQNLAFFLSQQNWPHAYVLHQGRGHEIWPDDIEAAAALWSQ